MGDLEHVSASIPRVFDAGARAAEEAERVELAAKLRAVPAPAPPGDAEIKQWTSPVPDMPWPPQLESRVTQAREAVQALDIDEALRILFAIELDLHMIMRRHEHVALRRGEG